MRIDNPSISGSLSFIGGTNSISATSVSLTGSLTGTFEGAFSGDSLTNISGAFNSVSASLASDISANASSINSLNAATSSYLLNTTDTLTGDLTVTGKITAQEFHTEFVSASIIYDSGSTKFGNSADDRHEFTGSVYVSNGITGTLTGNASTATSASYAATGPFLSSYTETDTLASVTGRGASTTTDISIANGQPKLRLKETDSTNVDKELLVSGGDFYIRNLNDNDTAGTNLLLVDSSGNLSATGRGQFAGALRVTETGTAQHILIGNQDSSGTNAPAMIRGVNAALQFGVGDSWSGEGGNFTIRLELKNDGNAYFSNSLGIGTSGPSNQLHIWNENSAYAKLENNADNYLLLGAVGGSNRIYSRTPANAAYPFAIEIGGNTAVQIDTSSNVGIGTTSPGARLHVGSTGTNAYSSTITKGSNMKGIVTTVASNTDDMVGIYFGTGATTEGTHWSGITGARSDNANHWGTQLNFYTHDNNTNALNDATQKMVIMGDGNVGIGETSPAAPLHIRGTSQTKYVDDFTNLLIEDQEARLQLISNTDGNQGSSIILSNIDKHWAIQNRGVSSNYNLAIGYVDTTVTTDIVGTAMNNVPLTLTTGGSVGIGTGTPKDVLDIKGGGVAEGGIAFGSKSVSISATFANVLTVSLGSHTGVYVKITAFGDWSSHSTIAYVGEFFLQNGGGGYMEPGIIIREDTNIYEASQDNDNVVAQIVDPGGSTGDRDFIIQLAATRSSGTPSGLPFTAHIQYEVRGQYKSIS